MDAIYLPAIQPDVLCNRWVSSPTDWMDPRLRGTPAYHPRALAAYPAWKRQSFAWEPGEWVFGDSGGYSVATQGAVIDPRQVIKWQVARCAVGVILDTPLGSGLGFQDCLRRTVDAVRAALPTYLAALDAGAPFRWWGVVHGRTPQELEEWWQAVSSVYPFTQDGEGWGFRPLPKNDCEAVADTLTFARQHGIRRAHLFACSSELVVATLCALGPAAGLEFATFDSTSPIKAGTKGREIAIPKAWGIKWVREDAQARDYLTHTCQCASCALLRQDLRDNRGVLDDDPYWVRRMVFHNVLAMLERFAGLQRRYGVGAKVPDAPQAAPVG